MIISRLAKVEYLIGCLDDSQSLLRNEEISYSNEEIEIVRRLVTICIANDCVFPYSILIEEDKKGNSTIKNKCFTIIQKELLDIPKIKTMKLNIYITDTETEFSLLKSCYNI